jgi:hypothetical protein
MPRRWRLVGASGWVGRNLGPALLAYEVLGAPDRVCRPRHAGGVARKVCPSGQRALSARPVADDPAMPTLGVVQRRLEVPQHVTRLGAERRPAGPVPGAATAARAPGAGTPAERDAVDPALAATTVMDGHALSVSPSVAARGVSALQRSAGNRAVEAVLAQRARSGRDRVTGRAAVPVQRHIGPTLPADLEPGTGTGTGSGGGLDYTALATQIRDAVEGLGTDEDAIYAALEQLGQDQARIDQLYRAYQTLTGRTLDADLDDDMSGDELRRAQRLLRPPDRRQQIETLLGTTDTGRWALGVIRRWEIPVDYEYSGTGSFHSNGSIYINRNLSVDAAVLVMMHEAQHANTFKSGAAADVEALGRDEYVRRKIADEAEAVVRQIEGAVPMQAAGHSLAGAGVGQAEIDRYRTAFYAYRDLLEANNPEMGRAEINQRCRTRTRDTEVTSWFHDGTFVTSTGHITYSEHYGRQWDGVHNPPSAPAH